MLVPHPFVSCVTLVALLSSIAAGQTRPIVRVADGAIRPLENASTAPAAPASAPVGVCGTVELAHHGEAVAGGGTLGSLAFINAATHAGYLGAAFFSPIDGSPRNQGIFLADAQGLHAVAVGCGGGGGSGDPGSGVGDPTPIGGTFSGLFAGTFFAPASNLYGDVLFLADVAGGSSPRALFLYTNFGQSIKKVAAIGDPLPGGGTIVAVSPGSISRSGTAVFGVRASQAPFERILRWSGGQFFTTIAAVGGPAPGGGTYTTFVSESVGFADGTSIPVGPLPDISDVGTPITFRAITSLGTRGIIVQYSILGGDEWWVKSGGQTPHGGTYFDFQGAIVNNAGQIAFFADWKPTPTTFNSGWFVGKPGHWRAALSFFDPVSTGQCQGLAFSRNPMQPLDEFGNLMQWVTVDYGSGVLKEAQVISAADGSITLAAQQGDANPTGGTWGLFDAWPSLYVLRGVFGASSPGGVGPNGYFQVDTCLPSPVVYCTAKTNSLGCVPQIGWIGIPSESASSGFSVTASNVLNQSVGMLMFSTTGSVATPFGGGTLCLQAPLRTFGQTSGGSPPPASDCSGTFSFDMNAFAHSLGGSSLDFPGFLYFAQYWSRDLGFAPPNNIGLTAGLQYTQGY